MNLKTAVALWLPAILCGCAAPIATDFRDCNLVFVSFDALQASHVGCLGAERDTTPALDAMARQGWLFSQVRSAASWTVPASMTWFTGVYPSQHRMVNKFAQFRPPLRKPANLKELSPELTTLADVLRASGYATAGFTGNAGVSGGFGYEQGFDVYDHELGKFGSMDRSIPRALEWLRANRDRKFFLFLHGYDIHGQNTPAAGYDYRFVAPGYDRRFLGSEQEQEVLREEGLENGKVDLRPADVQFWRAVYDEKVRRTDDKFAAFLREFDKLGLTGKTLFVLTSDHGTELYEHKRFDHGFTLYDEQIRVPLVIKPPAGMPGRVIRDSVGSIDLMPTILDLLNVTVPEAVKRQLVGTSLKPAMLGEPVSRDVFSETDYRQYTYKRSIVTGDGWKLIVTMETGSSELFDLNTDPGETRNLGDAQPQRSGELRRRLFAHFQSIGHDLALRRWETGLNPVYKSQEPKD